MNSEHLTSKQLEYLRDLINRHPNFRRETSHDGMELRDGMNRYYRNTNQPYPDDKMYIGDRDSVQASWVNAKYGQYIQDPLTTLKDLSREEATALIAHLARK